MKKHDDRGAARLRLSIETLRALTADHLLEAVGGMPRATRAKECGGAGRTDGCAL